MNPDQVARARQIFGDAIEAPPEVRGDLVTRACGDDAELRARVESLLQAHERGRDFLQQPTITADSSAPRGNTATLSAGEQPGAVIGPYVLQRIIGEGGFGTVFEAEQQRPLKRRVAFKVIKAGMDTRAVIARFDAERAALALMDHPNIARVLDAGATTTGRPYFVMELVVGTPLTQYCDEKNLPMRQRLELFITICQAVQHAHQKGIIHRDLKPSNVLISEVDGKPLAKVIDFGIAKATEQEAAERSVFTQTGQMIGTPLYMSPEQAGGAVGDIDTRTDIYSLGVLLYELLTGTTPFDAKTLKGAGFSEIVRIIREAEPPRPSARISALGTPADTIALHRRTQPRQLSQSVRGDLDWIVMKCIEKDRSRRYESISALTQDVQHYLSDEPVSAGPPSNVYRLKKFARRNRLFLAAASAIIVAILIGLIVSIIALYGEHEARHAAEVATTKESVQRGIAEEKTKLAQAKELLATKEAAKAKAANLFTHNILNYADPDKVGAENFTVRELLDMMSQAIDGPDKPALPEVEAAVHQMIGETYDGLGVFDRAGEHLQKSLDLARGVYKEDCEDLALAYQMAGKHAHRMGDYAKAETLLREALAIFRRLKIPQGIAANTFLLGIVMGHTKSLDESETLLNEALTLRGAIRPAEQTRFVASCVLGLSQIKVERGDLPGARKKLDEALTMLKAGPDAAGDEQATSEIIEGLAFVTGQEGDLPGAQALYREALRIYKKYLAPADPRIGKTLMNLGVLLDMTPLPADPTAAREAMAQAEGIYWQALPFIRQLPPEREAEAAYLIARLASYVAKSQGPENALPLLHEAWNKFGKRHSDSEMIKRANKTVGAVRKWIARGLEQTYTQLKDTAAAQRWKEKAGN